MNKNKEYHVASYVLQATPGQEIKIKSEIAQLKGTEIHATNAHGKIVFTIEGETQTALGNIADQIKYISGVLTLAPVYHQFLTEDS